MGTLKINKWAMKNRQKIRGVILVILCVILYLTATALISYSVIKSRETKILTANQRKFAIMIKQTPQEYYGQHKQQLLKNIAKQKKYLKLP